MSSEDDTILEAASRACSILGLTRSSPTIVSWQKEDYVNSRGARVVTPHFPDFEEAKVIISPVLRGRVDSEDWSGILAPSLIFYRRLWKRYSIGGWIRVLPALLLLLGIAFSSMFVPHLSVQLLAVFLAGILFMGALGAYGSRRWSRSVVLKADRKATLAIGTPSLVAVLQKLETLRELDASTGKDWPEYGDHPSLTKRIASLQSV